MKPPSKFTPRPYRGHIAYWYGDVRDPGVSDILDVVFTKDPVWEWKTNLLMDAIYDSATRLYEEAFSGPDPMNPMNFRLCLKDEMREEKRDRTREFKAAEAGTNVHAWIADHERKQLGWPSDDGLVGLTPEQEVQVAKAIEWIQTTGFRPLHIEESFHDPTRRVGGTPDMVGTMPGDDLTHVLDWKSGAALYASHELQVGGGYGTLVGLRYPDRGVVGHLIRLPKDRSEEVEHRVIPTTPEMVMAWGSCVNIYNYSERRNVA